jgi:hypothetical protein
MKKQGEIFRKGIGGLYLLARCGVSEVCLCSLRDGNRWHEPIQVVDPMNITEEEWVRISSDASTYRHNSWRKVKINIEDKNEIQREARTGS